MKLEAIPLLYQYYLINYDIFFFHMKLKVNKVGYLLLNTLLTVILLYVFPSHCSLILFYGCTTVRRDIYQCFEFGLQFYRNTLRINVTTV